MAFAAIEIIDARIQQIDPQTGKPRKVQDTISDNAANAGIVMGGRPVGPMDVDLRWCSAVCSRNGVVEETGVAAGVLGHPARGVAWLANKLHPYGVTLKAGEVMLGGSFTRPIAAAAEEPSRLVCASYNIIPIVPCMFYRPPPDPHTYRFPTLRVSV